MNENEPKDCVLLPADLNDKFGNLARSSREDFKREQEVDPSLKEVREKSRDKKSHYKIINDLVFRKTLDNRGGESLQLVVPLKFKLDVLGACHEGFHRTLVK